MYIPLSTDTNFSNDVLNLARRGTIKSFADATYEPIFSKNTAFNKDFGTGATNVATGNHTHTGTYEPAFSKNTAFNKNFGTTSGTVSEGDHTHTFLNLTDTPSSYPSSGLQKLVYETHSGLNFANVYYATSPDTRLMFRVNVSGTDVDSYWNDISVVLNKNNNISSVTPFFRLHAKQGTGTSQVTVGNWADNYGWLDSNDCHLFVGPASNNELHLRANGNDLAILDDTEIDFYRNIQMNNYNVWGIQDVEFKRYRCVGGHDISDDQGAWLSWNNYTGIGSGETEFVNHGGSGDGGFSWLNTNTANWSTIDELMTLDKDGILKIEDGTGSLERVPTSQGSTGGSGSAGSGNQYVLVRLNGTIFKLLHDGTI